MQFKRSGQADHRQSQRLLRLAENQAALAQQQPDRSVIIPPRDVPGGIRWHDLMKHVLDFIQMAGILAVCWQGYRHRRLRFCLIPGLLLYMGKHKPFWFRFLIYAPIFVSWLLLCHWWDARSWHATSAGLFAFAMVAGLEAMRQVEEQQKRRQQKD